MFDLRSVGADYSLPTQDFNFDTSWLGSADTSSVGDNLSSSGGGFNLGSLPWGKITNVLGKLGAGIGSGVSAYQSQQQPDYIPYTRWLGNGLAMTGYINNTANKQNKLDQAAGIGQILGNFPGNFFGLFNKDNNSFFADLRKDADNITSRPMYSGYVNTDTSTWNDYSLPTQVDYNQYRPSWL